MTAFTRAEGVLWFREIRFRDRGTNAGTVPLFLFYLKWGFSGALRACKNYLENSIEPLSFKEFSGFFEKIFFIFSDFQILDFGFFYFRFFVVEILKIFFSIIKFSFALHFFLWSGIFRYLRLSISRALLGACASVSKRIAAWDSYEVGQKPENQWIFIKLMNFRAVPS